MSTTARAWALSLTMVAVTGIANGGCAAPVEEEEPSDTSSQEIAVAIPVVAIAAEKVVGLILVGTAIIGGVVLNSYVEQRYAPQVTQDFRSAIQRENDFIAGRYGRPLFAGRALTAGRWVSAFGYPESAFNASRGLVRTAKDKQHRNKGGCVIATVSGENGTSYTGGAPYTSEFDILAAQFSAAARAYYRCGSADADVREAAQRFIPEAMPGLDPGTFVDYAVKSALLLEALTSVCKSPKFSVTLDTTKCR